MPNCSKCGSNLLQSTETCIACGRPNPLFKPRVTCYTEPLNISPINGRPRLHQRSQIRMVTPSGYRSRTTF